MILENKIENEQDDIEKFIKPPSTIEGKSDTTTKNKKWKRACPSCQIMIFYKSDSAFYYARNHNVLCKKYRFPEQNQDYIRNCPSCGSEIITKNKKYHKKCIRENKICSGCALKIWHKRKNHVLSIDLVSRKCPQCKKSLSSYKTHKTRSCKSCSAKNAYQSNPNIKKRLLVGILTNRKISNRPKIYERLCPRCNKIIKHASVFSRNKSIDKLCKSCSGAIRLDPYHNPVACKVIDEYGKKNGYNFQHAENNGEYKCLCYSLDGYDKNKNVAIEYDEPHHFNRIGQLSTKDIDRMIEITKYLRCKFIRINQSGDDYIILDGCKSNFPVIEKCN